MTNTGIKVLTLLHLSLLCPLIRNLYAPLTAVFTNHYFQPRTFLFQLCLHRNPLNEICDMLLSLLVDFLNHDFKVTLTNLKTLL